MVASPGGEFGSTPVMPPDWIIFKSEGSMFKVGLGLVTTCMLVPPNFSFCEGIILGSKFKFGNGDGSLGVSWLDLSLTSRSSA